jgi:Flp pilus assembly pilin Flp
MKEMFKSLRRKLQDNKGEVSVEWALVAVVMAGIIIAAFLPGVQGALTAAIASISSALTTAAS